MTKIKFSSITPTSDVLSHVRIQHVKRSDHTINSSIHQQISTESNSKFNTINNSIDSRTIKNTHNFNKRPFIGSSDTNFQRLIEPRQYYHRTNKNVPFQIPSRIIRSTDSHNYKVTSSKTFSQLNDLTQSSSVRRKGNKWHRICSRLCTCRQCCCIASICILALLLLGILASLIAILILRNTAQITTPSPSSSSSINFTTSTSTVSTSIAVTTNTFTTITATTTTTTKPLCTTRVTFDDIPSQMPTSGVVHNGYNNLNWTNVMYINTSTVPSSGYKMAQVSSSYVAYNPGGAAVEIVSANGTSFSFDQVNIAAGWRTGLIWTIYGYRLGVNMLSGSFALNPVNSTTVSSFSTVKASVTDWDELILRISKDRLKRERYEHSVTFAILSTDALNNTMKCIQEKTHERLDGSFLGSKLLITALFNLRKEDLSTSLDEFINLCLHKYAGNEIQCDQNLAENVILRVQKKFDLSLEIKLNSLGKDHSELAKTYALKEDYYQALISYQYALSVKLKSLPDNHHDIGDIYIYINC
ncbi:hypothetical protein I4U23_004940 [Adineta vaga]|nr:hypothetical protein I4U23_004940 [Adineta vaga]